MGRKLSAFLSQLYWLLGDLSERNKQEVKDFLLDFVSNEPQAKSRIERFPDDERAMASCCPHRKQTKLSDTAKHGRRRRRCCKICSRHFLSATGTARYRSQTNVKTWLKFLRCFFRRDSVRKCAETCRMQLWRDFHMRQRFSLAWRLG